MPLTHRLLRLALPGLALLAACQTDSAAPRALRIEPMAPRLAHGAPQADALLAIARYEQGRGRDDLAIAAYRRLLAIEPARLVALEQLAILLAGQGQAAEAVALLASAVTAAPDDGTLRNNLGYARLLAGDAAGAAGDFSEALRLAPDKPRIRDNLAEASRRLATPATPGEPLATAGTPDAKTAARVGAVPAQGSAVAPGTAAAPPLPTVPLPQVVTATAATSGGSALPEGRPRAWLSPAAPGVYTLRWPDRPTGPAGMAGDGAPPRLEIANGNGVDRMARQVSRQLASIGYSPRRVSNAADYRQATTVIQFRPGHAAAAAAIGAHLQPGIALRPALALRADIDVRLLLGRDRRQLAAVVASADEPLRLAAAGFLARP